MSHVLHRTNNILQYKTHFWKAIAIKVYTKSLNQHRFAVQLCTPWDFKTFQKYNIDKALSCSSYDIIISSFLMMHSNDWEHHLINCYFFKALNNMNLKDLLATTDSKIFQQCNVVLFCTTRLAVDERVAKTGVWILIAVAWPKKSIRINISKFQSKTKSIPYFPKGGAMSILNIFFFKLYWLINYKQNKNLQNLWGRLLGE